MPTVFPGRRFFRGALPLAAALAFTGCATQITQPPPTLTYRCDGDREFLLSVAPSGEHATIEIARMQFGLLAEPAVAGEKFGCSVLTLWREGETARVEMEGSAQFNNCRLTGATAAAR